MVINVMDYGAKCDGVTDDTAAVQRAIDAAGPGGTITAPPGLTVHIGGTLHEAERP